jgi:hypothetical protein
MTAAQAFSHEVIEARLSTRRREESSEKGTPGRSSGGFAERTERPGITPEDEQEALSTYL